MSESYAISAIDFDENNYPEIFKDAKAKEEFKPIFSHVLKTIIEVLSPQLSHEGNFDGSLIEEKLFKPFKLYLTGLPDDTPLEHVDAYLNRIINLDQSSGLCRRIFKNGESVFSCDDCSVDETCVLCIDCFNNGKHKEHNYRMCTSAGGGCCDCGDSEAWKQHYSCLEHARPDQALPSLSEFKDISSRRIQIETDQKRIVSNLKKLPVSVLSRYYTLCRECLSYAHELLTWTDTVRLPKIADFQYDEPMLDGLASQDPESKNFFTIVFNDEVHTYDQVISTLVKVIGCSNMTASLLAAFISREGRASVARGNQETCKKYKELIIRSTDENGHLKVQVIHGLVIAHQTFAQKIIQFIQKLNITCDSFKALTAFSLFNISGNSLGQPEGLTLLENIMLSNTKIWKLPRIFWNDLFTSSLLNHYCIKDRFSRLLTRNYPQLMKDYISDDHELAVSALSMVTQVYTCSSLVSMLIEEENALSIMADTLLKTCKALNDTHMIFKTRRTFDIVHLNRGLKIVGDFMSLISFNPIEWTSQLRNNVLESVTIFIELLCFLQNMDPVKRQISHHIEYDQDWESGMTLQQKLAPFLTRFIAYVSLDDDTLTSALKETLMKLYTRYTYYIKTVFDHETRTISYDVSRASVSIHLPLTRFAAALIVEQLLRKPQTCPYLAKLKSNHDDEFPTMIEVMEPSLRTQVMIAQYRSGLWRRNGFSLVNQILYYHYIAIRKEMYDRDILVLQEGAAMCEPNAFVIHLINKFNLFSWVTSDGPKSDGPLDDNSLQKLEDLITTCGSIADEFLGLLLIIIGERFSIGVGKVTEEDIIKNEIIQFLLLGASTRSEIIKKLDIKSDSQSGQLIKNVANLKQSSALTTGIYELKPEYSDRFNPHFYHFTRKDQSNALTLQLKKKKNRGESLICCPPPKPVELTSEFANLNQLLLCDMTLDIIRIILLRALDKTLMVEKKTKFPSTDSQMDKSLHLIGLGLYEQERNLHQFRYIELAHKKDIFSLLKSCLDNCSVNVNKDLIRWIINKSCEIASLLDAMKETHVDSRAVIDFIQEQFAVSDELESASKGKKRNAEVAAMRRERIMALMKANQQKFLSTTEEKCPDDETEKTDEEVCILCRERQKITMEGNPMVFFAFVQRSSVLSKNRKGRRIPYYATTTSNLLKFKRFNKNMNGNPADESFYNYMSDNSYTFDATFMPADLFFGPHISTCGHVVHLHCWKEYFNTVLSRDSSRSARQSRPSSYHVDKFEILCPYCYGISNLPVPILPNYTTFSSNTESASVFESSDPQASGINLARYINDLRVAITSSTIIPGIEDFITKISDSKITSKDFHPSLLAYMLSLTTRIHLLSLDFDRKVSDFDHSRIFMMTSWCVAYTLHATEQSSRNRSPFKNEDNSKNQFNCSLIRYACSSIVSLRSRNSPGDLLHNLLLRKISFLLIPDKNFNYPLSILDIDPVELFVSLSVLIQKLGKNEDNIQDACASDSEIESIDPEISSNVWATRALNHEYFKNTLHLILFLHLTQIIMSILEDSDSSLYDFDDDNLDDKGDSADGKNDKSREKNEDHYKNERSILESFLRNIVISSGRLDNSLVIDNKLIDTIKLQMLPFLTCCSIYYYYLSERKPKDYIDISSENRKISKDILLSNYRSLCRYLSLPENLNDLLACEPARDLVKMWLRHPRVSMIVKGSFASDKKTINQCQEQSGIESEDINSEMDACDMDLCELDDGARKSSLELCSKVPKNSSLMMPVKLIRQPHKVNRLIELPYDYSELVERVSNFSCPTIKREESATPTICLVCGVILCSQNYCCQKDLNNLASNYSTIVRSLEKFFVETHGAQPSVRVYDDDTMLTEDMDMSQAFSAPNDFISSPGSSSASSTSNQTTNQIHQDMVGSCTYHSYECSAGVGLFLRIRSCQLLLLSAKTQGCYMVAPYVDDHGEPDFGLRRGNPLRLNKEEYEKIQDMWLNHSLPEKISRLMEYPHRLTSGFNWHLL